ncbi:MAG: ABC transporter ATP-binding protein [Desulfobacula sp.]|nr:ABC transporter ATP-binding protein [Desulfobacula sp.]
MKTSLKIENLVINGKNSSGWFPIVQDVSIEVKPGQVVAIIGESGAGKTTLALSLLSYTRPGTRIVQGHVYLGDKDILAINFEKRRQLRGMKVAYVAQGTAAALNPVIRLGKQIAECLLVHGIGSVASARKRTKELLQLLDLPDPEKFAQRFPHQVSGGQQQRVMVAMAMACLPEFLVFDEPTTALDVTTQIEVLKAIKAVISENGTGAIYVTHDLAVVAQVADWIVVMHDGKIIEEGKTEKILNNPWKEYTKELLKAVRLIPDNSEYFNTDRQKKIESSVPVLMIKAIRASYEKGSWLHPISENQHILRGVDFSIGPGEVVALVGESGSGKSTMARVIAGLLSPNSGKVMFQGTNLDPMVRGRSLDLLRRIQIVFQSPDTTLNLVKRIEEAIGRPLELYFKMKGKRKRDRVEELLKMVELPPDYADRYPSELSGGEKQRIALARAFVAKPDLILCDEVLSALDTVVGATILNLLKDLQARLGVACLFISHDLATVATIADRVVVLYAGRVCEEGSTGEVFSPPFHPYTALLIASVPELRCGWLEDVLVSQIDVKDAGVAPMDSGCAFRTRCIFYIKDICDLQAPVGKKNSESHIIYCHREIHELSAVKSDKYKMTGKGGYRQSLVRRCCG